jgi:hypothetical protein
VAPVRRWSEDPRPEAPVCSRRTRRTDTDADRHGPARVPKAGTSRIDYPTQIAEQAAYITRPTRNTRGEVLRGPVRKARLTDSGRARRAEARVNAAQRTGRRASQTVRVHPAYRPRDTQNSALHAAIGQHLEFSCGSSARSSAAGCWPRASRGLGVPSMRSGLGLFTQTPPRFARLRRDPRTLLLEWIFDRTHGG